MIAWGGLEMRILVLTVVSALTIAAAPMSNWELYQSVDPVSNRPTANLIAKYGRSGGLAFDCNSPGNPKSKVTESFIANEFLGESPHLQKLFIRFDSDPAWDMVGNYPGKSVVFFPSSRRSMDALTRAESATKVYIRAFRYDGTPVEAEIPLEGGSGKIEAFRNACFGSGK